MNTVGATGNAAGYKTRNIPRFTPEQMDLFQRSFGHVAPGSYISRLAAGDEALHAEREAPALRQFAELQGGLASRFSGGGSMGSRHSSGFQNTANQASANFAQDLQSQRQQLQRQAILDMLGISSSLLEQRPYEEYLEEEKHEPSFWERLFGGAATLGGAGIGGFFGGPAGAQVGGKIGSQFSQAFY